MQTHIARHVVHATDSAAFSSLYVCSLFSSVQDVYKETTNLLEMTVTVETEDTVSDFSDVSVLEERPLTTHCLFRSAAHYFLMHERRTTLLPGDRLCLVLTNSHL